MAIKQYSLAKDGVKQLAPGFRVREFRCRDGSETKHSNGYFLAKKELRRRNVEQSHDANAGSPRPPDRKGIRRDYRRKVLRSRV